MPAPRRNPASIAEPETPAGVGWVVVTLIAVVAVAVGVAGGYVFGTQRGIAFNGREAAEAKSAAATATESQKAAEAKLARLMSESAGERQALADAVKDRDSTVATLQAEVKNAKSQIPLPMKKLATAAEAIAGVQRTIADFLASLPKEEQPKLRALQVAIETQLDKDSKLVRRPEKLIDGDINVGKDKVGLAGHVDGRIFFEKIVDDSTSVLRVESLGAQIQNERRPIYQEYYFAQNVTTKGHVDGSVYGNSGKWVIVGTKKVPLTSGSSKTMWVIEPLQP